MMNKLIKSPVKDKDNKMVYNIPNINKVAEKASNGSTEARDELIQSHMTLVKGLVYKYAPAHPQYEDLISEAYQALTIAADTYKPGSNFVTWAHTLIKNAILHYINYKARTVHIPHARNGNEQKEIAYQCVTTTDCEDDYEDQDLDDEQLKMRKMLELAFTNGVLTEEQARVLRLKFYESKKIKEISQIISIPENKVNSLVHNALKKLNKYLTKNITK